MRADLREDAAISNPQIANGSATLVSPIRNAKRAVASRTEERSRDPLRVLMVTSEWPEPGSTRPTVFIRRQAEFLQAAGVALDVFAFRGSQNPLNYVSAWRRFQPMLRSGRYDLVHAQFGQSGLLALPRRLPLVVTFRGCDLLGIISDKSGRPTVRGRMLQVASRLVARQADAVIVVSDHMRQYFTTKAPVHVVPSGLDLERFRPIPQAEARQQLGLSQTDRLVLFAGSPQEARKRYQLAQQAVALLPDRLAAKLIVAWGVPHENVPLYMNAADVLIVASKQEGSPNVVKEALACNLPVVSVPVGDVAERLRGVSGSVLCADDAPATISAGLARVLARGQRSDGRSAVRELDETVCTQRVIDIYRSVLNGRTQS